MRRVVFAVLVFALALPPLAAQARKNKVYYEKAYEDPVLKEMDQVREASGKAAAERTDKIRQELKARQGKEERRSLKSDLTGVEPPASVEAFHAPFHFPPQAQYSTNTCWSFSTTSFYESEIFRLTGKKIKLSEMWTVYHEYLEKVHHWVETRGGSLVAEGGESNALPRVWKKYGIVPAEAYPGIRAQDGRHDHVQLFGEIKAYLDLVKRENIWDEGDVESHLRLILNKYLGEPPRTFSFGGRTMTAPEFLARETGLVLDDYVEVMSTSYYPFYTRDEFRAPDNWWHSREYVNLPLDVWYGHLVSAAKRGYTVAIGGDVSEPGKIGQHNVCFIPSFDIPAAAIDQDSREFRIANHTTEDDHGIHLLGHVRHLGHDWFLIKDSGRSARWGKFEGYYFFRGDFIKLKMLTYTVHKDLLKDVLPKVTAAR